MPLNFHPAAVGASAGLNRQLARFEQPAEREAFTLRSVGAHVSLRPLTIGDICAMFCPTERRNDFTVVGYRFT